GIRKVTFARPSRFPGFEVVTRNLRNRTGIEVGQRLSGVDFGSTRPPKEQMQLTRRTPGREGSQWRLPGERFSPSTSARCASSNPTVAPPGVLSGNHLPSVGSQPEA